MISPDILVLLVFAVTYLIIALQKFPFLHLDRPAASLSGAVLMVAIGAVTLDEAYHLIDWNTITLLFGMMILVGALRDGGFFKWLSYYVLSNSHNSNRLIWVLVFLSGILSAFFVNDTICILMTPIVLAISEDGDIPAVPLLIALATSSNIGSVMTLVGNPQNMLIGIFSGISFIKFFLILFPVAVLGLTANAFLIKMIYKKQLPSKPFELHHLVRPNIDRFQVYSTLTVFFMVLIMFILGFNLAYSAIMGAVLTMLIARKSPQAFFVHVDWALLLLFCGLFVVVGAFKTTHWMEYLKFETGSGSLISDLIHFSGLTIIASNVVSNVPFVMLMESVVKQLQNAELFWIALAMASTFAGNFTLLGSVANIIVAETSKHKVHLTFKEFLKVGILTTLISTSIGVIWIWLVI